jgi:hypothetical protein
LRLRIAGPVWIAVCGAALLVAQAPPPGPNLAPAAAKAYSQAKPPRPAAQAPGQVIFDATGLGSPLVLDKGWRVGISSDPEASSPAFDDHAWAARDAEASFSEVPDEDETAPLPAARPAAAAKKPASAGQSAEAAAPPDHPDHPQRFAWFRMHVKLAPNHGPLALLMELPVSRNASFGLDALESTPDVFVNGKKVAPEGPHGHSPGDYQPISRIYKIDLDPSQTSLTLAVRTMNISFGYGAYTTFFANRTLKLGNQDDLERGLKVWSNQGLFERIPRLVYAVLLAVLAAFLFALYFAQKGHPEYLWLALHELVQAPIGFIELAGSSAQLNSLWYGALFLQLILISAYFFFEFLAAFLYLKRRWYLRALRYTAPLLALVGPVLLMIGHRGAVAVLMASVFFCMFLWLVGWSIFIFGTLISATLKRNFEAGLLLIPLIFGVIGIAEPVITSILREDSSKPSVSPLTMQAGPIPIHFSSIADFTGILVILLIIFFRFLHVQRDQEHATNELAAARSVQELLIPREKLATPGFEVDSIYSPANEVGGDFFHVQTVGFDGILVVIGDVAGKGLKAAMNVSLLMGALRRTPDRSPARVLQALNGVLTGADSFTTCQAVWFGVNGEMVIANAGHLPPYLNSQEITLPGGLPLGVLADVRYEEARFYLHPGDRVLLMSDGVVEARQANGELFGFDRVRQLAHQTATYLAEAAKSFGQQDDITVLTVRRQVQVTAA